MKEAVALAKEADAKKGVSPTRSDNSILRVRNVPERQLGSLRGVIGNIRRDGGTPSVESFATQLSGVHATQRAPALLALQQTHGNRYVQRVVAGIQAKLVVGQPGDIYEQEADRVADEVMQMPEPEVQRQVEPEEEELLQTKTLTEKTTPLVQRQVEEEEEEILQTKRGEDVTPEVTPDLESQINAIKGGGRPLAESERAFFEPRFGYDFSRVRVHTDTQAAESAQAVKARAFTVGGDVAFGAGQYAPGTFVGRKMLAHELSHVVQQSQCRLPVNQTMQTMGILSQGGYSNEYGRESTTHTPLLEACASKPVHMQREVQPSLPGPSITQPPSPFPTGFESDRDTLRSILEDFTRELNRATPDEDVLKILRETIRLRVERIILSLEEYVRQGLRLDDMEMAIKQLPWPPQLEGERDRVIRTIREMRQGTP